jgi:2-polyprenyl-3-methyl-5-hydroxy-6-metoxy-1,4-benzoquinol methylase
VQSYEYEAHLINTLCKEKNYKKILEIGPGPGVLSQIILKNDPELDYTLIDKIHAKNIFENRNYKGNFIVRDLMDSFDITGLDTDYDLIIANDFLEHISNPSDVLYKAGLITKEKSGFFISVPNWRMGHNFIYRGLFDYDNFFYFCHSHGWDPIAICNSNLTCQYHPKLSSEKNMPDHLIQSWNWYFYTEKIVD